MSASAKRIQGHLFSGPEASPLDSEFLATRILGMPDGKRLAYARSFTAEVLKNYWYEFQKQNLSQLSLRPVPPGLALLNLASSDRSKADEIAALITKMSSADAGYRLGCLYTSALPEAFRSSGGVFYTPPAMCERLLDLATRAGVDWASARVLDPACGGAAFLAPVAQRLLRSLKVASPMAAIDNISRRIRGFEIDPFAAWISQVLVEIVLSREFTAVDGRLPEVAFVKNSLQADQEWGEFDLIIGNPPYGRTKLTTKDRARFSDSLFGHANMYGLFTAASLPFVKPKGVLAFVTPTSMLGGEYYKNLRRVLGTDAPPVFVDLVSARSGVFEDVLQETMLAVYRKGFAAQSAKVHFFSLSDCQSAQVCLAGDFSLPVPPDGPWILPRAVGDEQLVKRLNTMHARLKDYGYRVSTGPLVWNRHKSQFRANRKRGLFPVVWAEAVTSNGIFKWRSKKRNHLPWFAATAKTNWVLASRPCILVQRTTSKEQTRRIIAAELPQSFIDRHGSATIENHLNVIWCPESRPVVSRSLLTRLLNSRVIDRAFRCINGSVAVSAYELEALPLPNLQDALRLQSLLDSGIGSETFEKQVAFIYSEHKHAASSVA